MSKHTPGPWEGFAMLSPSENDRGFRISAHDGRDGRVWIADVSPVIKDDRGDASEEGKANARLIAAAPELLEVVVEGLKFLEGIEHLRTKRPEIAGFLPSVKPGIENFKAVISKAEGK